MLKARDVWEEAEDRRERRMKAMRPVLSQLYGQIRKQAIHSPNAPYIVFEVPPYVFGYPLFKLSEARDYIMKTLTEGGYMAWVVDEKYLLISWMKINGKTASHRPPLLTNYRPQVYDPSTLGAMR
jgi:hypothetical protein